MERRMTQKETEEFLRNLSAAVDDILEEVTGERIPFCLILFPKDEENPDMIRSNYISNAPREDMTKALRATLLRWESGSDDRLDRPQNPTLN